MNAYLFVALLHLAVQEGLEMSLVIEGHHVGEPVVPRARLEVYCALEEAFETLAEVVRFACVALGLALCETLAEVLLLGESVFGWSCH